MDKNIGGIEDVFPKGNTTDIHEVDNRPVNDSVHYITGTASHDEPEEKVFQSRRLGASQYHRDQPTYEDEG